MKYAILSDSHDRTDRLATTIEMIQERGITEGIHLGDFCSPFVLEQLAESGIHWYCVWGNNDGDRLVGYQSVAKYKNMDVATTDFRELFLKDRKLFLTHYPDIARIAAATGKFDAVFFGHSHKSSQEVVKDPQGDASETVLANPGEVGGIRTGKATFGVYDTESNSFEVVEVPKRER